MLVGGWCCFLVELEFSVVVFLSKREMVDGIFRLDVVLRVEEMG